MTGDRVLVKSADGSTIREVAKTAVPVLAAGGWAELTSAEQKKYAKEQAAAREERRRILDPSTPTKSGAAGQETSTIEQES